MSTKCPQCHADNPDTKQFCGDCGTQLTPSPEKISPSVTKTLETPVTRLAVGSLFAERYEVLEELGRGGMGEVYRVKDEKLDEEMALKVLKPEIAAHKDMIQRFKNELKLSRKIAHRHICKMYDLNEEEETPYITMEYVRGENLKSAIRKKGKLDEKEAIAIAKQVCEGLAEAHELGVVHRDLKPQNIMIDEKGNAKVMDFGIARSIEAAGVTQTGMMIGTPDYMSPEQAEGEEADQRSDIYAMGVILYEMVTGGVPFKGDTAFSVALKHKTKLPQDPKKINPKISDDLSRLILICLEKERERRYQSAEALLDDLRNIKEGLPLGTKVRPRRETLITTLKREKLLIPAVAAVLAIMAVLIWQLLPGKAAVTPMIENSIAVISFENLTGDEANDTLQRTIPNLLITNLENSGFFHVVTWDRLRDLMKQVGRESEETIDKDLGFEICRREGIEAVVLGSVMKVGSVFATDVKVFDVATQELIKSAASQGEGIDSIINTQIAELSREIALGVGITREELASTNLDISEFTTTSMEAYNYFIRGREDFYDQYIKDAITRLEKAVELDPNFAMAHLYLGYTYNNLANDRKKAIECYEKAKALSDRVTEKERLLIEAEIAGTVEGRTEKWLEILTTVIEKYPRDKQARVELCEYYRIRQMWPEVIKHAEIILALDPHRGDAYEELAFAYASTGNDEKALEYLQQGSAAIPGDPRMNLTAGQFYVKMGKIDDAIRKFKDALDIKPDFTIENFLAYAYAMKEDYVEAIRWSEKFSENPISGGIEAKGYWFSGFYHYWLGNYKQAVEDLQKAWDIVNESGNRDFMSEFLMGYFYYKKGEWDLSRDYVQGWHDGLMEPLPESAQEQRSEIASPTHWVLGLIDIKQGHVDSARAHLKEMEAWLPKRRVPGGSGYYELLGEILLAEKSYDEAISVLKDIKQRKMPWIWNTRYILGYNVQAPESPLAQAYKEKGDLDEAIAIYERLTDPNPENREGRLIYPKNYYELAILYEMKGSKAKAIRLYEKFLTLWKDADPGLAEVEDAKQRLAALKIP
jgi:serine/threonine protein kinase/tetratricopeptide (TPR) repeat protein